MRSSSAATRPLRRRRRAARRRCSAPTTAVAPGSRSAIRTCCAENHQMYVRGDKLILLAEPHGWWISTDQGRTFTHDPAKGTTPYLYHEAFGRYQACCDADDNQRVVEFAGGKMRPVPTQPPIPSVGTVGFGRDLLYAAGLRDGRPVRHRVRRPRAHLAADRGGRAPTTWSWCRSSVSYGGEHAWLIGRHLPVRVPSALALRRAGLAALRHRGPPDGVPLRGAAGRRFGRDHGSGRRGRRPRWRLPRAGLARRAPDG